MLIQAIKRRDMENPVLSAEMKFAIIICCELENNSDIEGE